MFMAYIISLQNMKSGLFFIHEPIFQTHQRLFDHIGMSANPRVEGE